MRDERIFAFREIQGIPERMWQKISISSSHFFKGFPCWEWTGAKVSGGYGRFRWEARSAPAHRVMYLLAVGSAKDLDVDHLCRNPSCVNPTHLEAVSHAENIRRGDWSANAVRIQLAKTQCANGHLYTPATLYVPPETSRSQRQCRVCRRENKRLSRERRSA
jgi:hypothetical protein